MPNTILVTGAAGYIGSVIVECLLSKGYRVVAFDNLITGHRKAVASGAIFELGDVTNSNDLKQLFGKYEIDAVVHMAAKTLVDESILNPMAYYETNLIGGIQLVQAMIAHNVKRIVFSSTAAVYGETNINPITENHVTNPLNPYGESKLAFEKALAWFSEAYKLECFIFRYFNAAGATSKHGEDHTNETHLIPLVLKAAISSHQNVQVFGDDYDTRDGTCIRDYIHIEDLINAHILAMDHIVNTRTSDVFNLGSGEGYSVKEMIEAAKEATNLPIPSELAERRAGDPARLIASSAKAKKILGWERNYTNVKDIIASAWKFHLAYKEGFSNE